MRKLLLSVLFLMVPLSAWAWTTTNHFDTPNTEDGWYVWQSGYGGVASITDTQYAPNGPGKSLQLMSPVGFPDSGVVGGASVKFPSPTKELWMQYYFKYSSNFDFHKVGNKQIYVWNNLGVPEVVIDGPIFNGNKMSPSIKHVWLTSNTGYNPVINRGQWYKVVFHLKIVSPGNDIFQLWVDDGLVSNYQNATITNDYSTYYSKAAVDPVWGGQGNTPKTETDWQWYDSVIISTDPITVGKGGGDEGTLNKRPSYPTLNPIK